MLRGCRTPYALRQRKAGMYELVGGAYLQGLIAYEPGYAAEDEDWQEVKIV